MKKNKSAFETLVLILVMLSGTWALINFFAMVPVTLASLSYLLNSFGETELLLKLPKFIKIWSVNTFIFFSSFVVLLLIKFNKNKK